MTRFRGASRAIVVDGATPVCWLCGLAGMETGREGHLTPHRSAPILQGSRAPGVGETPSNSYGQN